VFDGVFCQKYDRLCEKKKLKKLIKVHKIWKEN
jgi:hypothetical protein